MKTHTIQHDMSIKQGYHTGPVGFREKHYSAGLCEDNKQGYIAFKGGSGASKEASKTAAKAFKGLGNTFLDKIYKSEKYQKMLEIFENKTVVAQALVALGVAGVMRPVTNMAMAGKKDKEDGMYAAAHAISSAVIGFVVSFIVMAPFDKAFKKIKEDPKKYLRGLEKIFGVEEIGKRKLEKSKAYKNVAKVAQMVPDSIILGIPKAILTIALIPPILKYVFGLEKKPKQKLSENNTTAYAGKLLDKPVFNMFKKGVK